MLDWCKLFGSDNEKHQPTHWKDIVPVSGHADFRRKLFAPFGEDRWRSYRKEMMNYRNKFVAHDEANYPSLDIAVKSSYFYYGYVRKEFSRVHGKAPQF